MNRSFIIALGKVACSVLLAIAMACAPPPEPEPTTPRLIRTPFDSLLKDSRIAHFIGQRVWIPPWPRRTTRGGNPGTMAPTTGCTRMTRSGVSPA
jgi:hypothetical protein